MLFVDLARAQLAFATSRGSDARTPLLLQAAPKQTGADRRRSLAGATYLDAMIAANYSLAASPVPGADHAGGGPGPVSAAAANRCMPPGRQSDLLLDGPWQRTINEGYAAPPALPIPAQGTDRLRAAAMPADQELALAVAVRLRRAIQILGWTIAPKVLSKRYVEACPQRSARSLSFLLALSRRVYVLPLRWWS